MSDYYMVYIIRSDQNDQDMIRLIIENTDFSYNLKGIIE